jgi:hypothetical protein
MKGEENENMRLCGTDPFTGDGRKIAETTSKTQFDTMNKRSNGKSRIGATKI